MSNNYLAYYSGNYNCGKPCLVYPNCGYNFSYNCSYGPNGCGPCAPCGPNACGPNPCNPCGPNCGPNCVPNCGPVCVPNCPPQIIAYITYLNTTVTVPSGVTGAAPPTFTAGLTTFPPVGVNVITGYSGLATTNVGGITLNPVTGLFTIPTCGRYQISAYIDFAPSGTNPAGTREVYIYKIDASTSIVSLLALDGRLATTYGTTTTVVTGPTYVSISTSEVLNPGDKIFYAVTQNSGVSINVQSDSRFEVVRM